MTRGAAHSSSKKGDSHIVFHIAACPGRVTNVSSVHSNHPLHYDLQKSIIAALHMYNVQCTLYV